MPLVRLEDRYAAAIAPHDGERRIEDGQAEREDGHDKRDRRGGLHRADDADACEHVAEEHAAGVAHEDARGVEVVVEEPERRARDGRREDGDEHDALLERDEEDRDRGDRRDAGREPVEPVDEVHGIREPDDPEERRRNREPFEEQIVAEGIRDEVDAHVEADDEHRRCDDLPDELDLRGQVRVVIDEAERHNERAAHHESLELEGNLRVDGHIAQHHEHRRQEREVDAQPADARHRPLVNLACIRRVHRARLFR